MPSPASSRAPRSTAPRGQVAVTLVAEPQRRVYVRRIDVAGNTRTRDEVVRREFRQLESAWYDGGRIKLSRDRVDRLGYFKDVNVDTNEVAGAPDQVDLVVNGHREAHRQPADRRRLLQRREAGPDGSIKQDNVFGSGNYLGIELNTSRTNRTLVLSTVDPYFTVDGISRAVDVFYRTSRPLNPGRRIPDQHAGRVGALRRAGLRLRHRLRGHRCREHAHRHLDRHPEQLLTTASLRRQQPDAFAADAGLGARRRDSALAPRPAATSASTSSGALPATCATCAPTCSTRSTGRCPADDAGRERRTRLGKGLGGKPYPVFKNFYGGGLGRCGPSSRARWASSTPPAPSSAAPPLQPQRRAVLPGAGHRQRQAPAHLRLRRHRQRLARGREDHTAQLRASAGLGLSWISPVGPLKLSWGVPLRVQRNDRIQRFQFQIGTAF
jgi:outer membrane protein insertion porin family